MKKKPVLYTEMAYILGLVLITIGVMFAEKSDFGVSMVVAPAYVLYRWVSTFWGSFTFGMAEYCLQGVLIVIMSLVMRKFRVSYLLSFVTAVIYGFILDGVIFLGSFLPSELFWQRIICFFCGMIFCAAGVAMMFRTYLSPEAYELFVKEVAEHFGIVIHKFKTAYDCTSFVVGLGLSFLFFGFGKFVGIGWGTVVLSLINGSVIGWFSALYERGFEFRDALSWRPFFEDKKD